MQGGLAILLEALRAGEITSLDGVDSPLSRRIAAHHGVARFEMNHEWVFSSQDWTCPGCSRSKFEISRVGTQGQILAKLVTHHDHMKEALFVEFDKAFGRAGTTEPQPDGRELIGRVTADFAAFDNVRLCEDCNNADAEAKKELRLPQHFSFSVGQISRFIRCQAHRPHQLDRKHLVAAWGDARAAYERRIRLIMDIANAAATGRTPGIPRGVWLEIEERPWYEPYSPEISMAARGRGEEDDRAEIRARLGAAALYDALNPLRTRSNRTGWRTKSPPGAKPLPTNYEARILSVRPMNQTWSEVPDKWCCPICKRNKHATVYVAEDGDINFLVADTRGMGAWAVAPRICNHCEKTLHNLAMEVTSRVGERARSKYTLVTPSELASIIVPRSHSHHRILPREAAALVEVAIYRRKTWEECAPR